MHREQELTASRASFVQKKRERKSALHATRRRIRYFEDKYNDLQEQRIAEFKDMNKELQNLRNLLGEIS